MSRLIELTTTDPAQTREVGAMVAAVIVPGDVVALTGELGAGKTCFVQGAAAALGVTGQVTSPSFLLRKDYQGRVNVMHLDVYRLETLQQVLDVGFDEALEGDVVTFVEWGDAMAPLLPVDHLEVEMRLPLLTADSTLDETPEPRTILLRAKGDSWARRLTDLEPDLRAHGAR